MTTVDFQQYLQTLLTSPKYQQWQERYIETDVILRDRAQFSQRSSRQIDWELMAEVWQPSQKTSKQMSLEEEIQGEKKVERFPVLEALQKYAPEQILLVGQPGSGKSTTLERLLWQQAKAALEDRAVKIPVLIELRSYQHSTLACIEAFFAEYGLDLSPGQIEELLAEKKLLLLVDGLNELPSEEVRKEVAAFRKQYPTAAIFTTRELNAEENLGIEKRLEMQPLANKQIEEFVLAYLPKTGIEFSEKLDRRLAALSRIPLFLWMLCEVFKQLQKMPEDLGKLLRFFTQNQVSLKLKEGVAVDPELRDRAPELLQTLAVTMMEGKTRVDLRLEIPFWEAEKVLALALQQQGDQPTHAREWLKGLLSYHLVQLERDRSGREVVQFRHQLIQEYYAAEWLLSQLETLDSDRLKQEYLNYLKWTEPIAMMLNLLDNREQALRIIRLALEVDLQLGARLAGEVQEQFQQETVEMVLACKVPKRVKFLWFERVVMVQLPKRVAIQLLGKSNKALEFLSQTLNNSSSEVRRSAAQALGDIGKEREIEPLNLLKDADSQMGGGAAQAPEDIAHPRVLPYLIESGKEIPFSAIANIQERFGFYNYWLHTQNSKVEFAENLAPKRDQCNQFLLGMGSVLEIMPPPIATANDYDWEDFSSPNSDTKSWSTDRENLEAYFQRVINSVIRQAKKEEKI
jgi:energy-coupling factor transporter ATP-binding protein EcfA2